MKSLTKKIAALTGIGLIAGTTLAASVPAHAATVRPADNTGAHQAVQYINWDGSCLDIHTAVVGERLSSAACGSPGDIWWLYTSGASTGQLSPQGHPGLSVGDSGGLLELRTAPSTPVIYNGTMSGYRRICFFNQSVGGCVNGTYWLSNGVGNNVTLTGTSQNDVYWLPNAA